MPSLDRPVNVWHCVRCHCSYTRPENNNSGAGMTCTIQHRFDMTNPTLLPATVSFAPMERRYLYPALCCPGVFLTEIHTAAGVKTVPVGVCFSGKHTTNPKQVTYNGYSARRCEHSHSN